LVGITRGLLTLLAIFTVAFPHSCSDFLLSAYAVYGADFLMLEVHAAVSLKGQEQ
jgi:hypothetical protein